MFTSILHDIQAKLAEKNPLWLFIIACLSVFLIDKTLVLIGLSTGSKPIADAMHTSFALPLYFAAFIQKPWTVFTYAFLHADFFHLLINMYMLYWFGQIYSLYLGDKYLTKILIGGALTGGLVALLAYQFIPFLKNPLALLVGASAAVEAVIFAATALNPEHEVRLLIIGRVQLKYIAFFSLVLNYISIAGTNAGGVLAHLGGAFFGFMYIKQIQNGVDVFGFTKSLKKLFTRSQKLKVVHRQPNISPRAEAPKSTNRLDEILDKINVSGYDSLSKEEKDFLFQYSNQND